MRKRLARIQEVVSQHRALADQLDERLDSTRAPRLHMARAHEIRRGVVTMDVPLRFDSPESSTVLAAIYNPAESVLTVHFKRGKRDKTPRVYTYTGYPSREWVKFVQAESKGQFFATFIRPYYQGQAVAA